VGKRRSAAGRQWSPTAIAAFAVLGLGVVLFVAVLVSRVFANGGGSASAGNLELPTPIPASATVPPSPAASPTAPTAVATATAPSGGIPVQCGDILAPLDKQHVLPADCVPPVVNLPAAISIGPQQLTAPTIAALQEMFAAAAKDGYPTFQVDSGYRSYDTQVQAYNGAVAQYGKDYADRTSALPGHSEHQLGTTADVCARGLCLEDFIGSPEATWLSQNSWKYGFIVSYPDGKEAITGYAAEPWHVRYVAKPVAQQVHDSGLTLHEFLLKR
jgi:D-alanyl-D-alanine carboxypeptidase